MEFSLKPEVIQLTRKKWKDLLFDEQLGMDIFAFKCWDGNLSFHEKHILDADIVRTRSSLEFFKTEKTRRELAEIATFYCKQNSVNYQQSMLEVKTIIF